MQEWTIRHRVAGMETAPTWTNIAQKLNWKDIAGLKQRLVYNCPQQKIEHNYKLTMEVMIKI